MCGNFGLLLLSQQATAAGTTNNSTHPPQPKKKSTHHADFLDHSLNASMHQVSKANGIVLASELEARNQKKEVKAELLPAIKILEAQTAATEIRGGQAGGYSALEYQRHEAASTFESRFAVGSVYEEPVNTRVRCVARKRHPLATDLAKLFINDKKRDFHSKATVTVIGHTRFATSSQNLVPELHPHEWVPFHNESVWLFNNSTGVFERSTRNVGVHITHNGDFDALDAYGQEVTVGDVGLWLERVLRVPNNLNGDSPKVAGCMDLFRVQGRLAAAARLAYIRVILGSITDVSNNEALTKSAPNSFPAMSYFQIWESYIEEVWQLHMNNVIKVVAPGMDANNYNGIRAQYRYMVDRKAVKQLIQHAVNLLLPPKENVKPLSTGTSKSHRYTPVNTDLSASGNGRLGIPSFVLDLNASLHDLGKSLHSLAGGAPTASYETPEQLAKLRTELRVGSWSHKQLTAYVSTVVRGFLFQDLYNTVIEFLSRASGSFGLQVHCSLEPGVVVIGSKGQPMSLGYDPNRPIVLFASEASALAVPVDKDQKWLSKRIDLDSHGEIIRIGEPRSFMEGSFHPIAKHTIITHPEIEESIFPFSEANLRHNDNINTPGELKKESSVDSSSRASTASISFRNATIYPINSSTPSSPPPSIQHQHAMNAAASLSYELLHSSSTSPKSKEKRPSAGSTAIKRPSTGNDRSAYDLLNDRISVHEKFQPRNRSSSLSNSINGSSVHNVAIRPATYSQLNDSFHDGNSRSHATSTPRAITMLTNMLEDTHHSSSHHSSLPSSTSQASIPSSLMQPLPPPYSPVRIPENTAMFLSCGIELRSYSLDLCGENSAVSLAERSADMLISPLPYDPNLDLVGKDLNEIPATIFMIDRAWTNPTSIESITAESLSHTLYQCIQHRMKTNVDTIDLLISGVEVSLWVAEQFAADMRLMFPQLNVVTISANKLLSLGHDHMGRVLFPGSDSIPTRCIDNNTCAILLSQSGQTFPCLHATRSLSQLVEDRLWILTGCFGSKMEDVLKESYNNLGKPYGRNRVFNNYAGHRPAEPASLSIVSTWHTLTRFLLYFIDYTRRICPQGRVIHPWKYDNYAEKIQKWYRDMKSPSSHGFARFVQQLISKEKVKMPHQSNHKTSIASKKISMKHEKVVMLLSDGCVHDMHRLVQGNFINNISMIVGYNHFHQPVSQQYLKPHKDDSKHQHTVMLPYDKLVAQGKRWGAHLNEPWHVLVFVGIYLFFSVGFGLPLFGLLADAIWKFLRIFPYISSLPAGSITFSLRAPHIIATQPIGYTLVGVAIQLIDAWWYIYLAKHMVWFCRWVDNRPMAARMGKRTIVVVDIPAIHQLTENFCSKLFAQGYSFNSPDVHGASGLDHFVHRFTHRVARGLLLVIGRPDGRLCNLAKSESAVILAAKQAAFIRNPDYKKDGSGPDIVTIGHNPYQPSLGYCKNITLQPSIIVSSPSKMHHKPSVEILLDRKKFLDEYIYDRCNLASKPFTLPILRSVIRDHALMSDNKPFGSHHIDPNILFGNPSAPMIVDFITQSKDLLKSQSSSSTASTTSSEQHDNPSSPENMIAYEHIKASLHDDININLESYHLIVNDSSYRSGCNPGSRLAFLSRLDSTTQTIEELQLIVQQFYECRIASIERYVSYCVMFHAMVEETKHPWLRVPWDPARSQSNLRVATTASPVSAEGSSHTEVSKEVKQIMKDFALKLRGYKIGF